MGNSVVRLRTEAVTNKIQVDKGIPFPSSKRDKYPWREMEVGDSFFVPGKVLSDFSSFCLTTGRRLGKTFRPRLVPGGVRIWRLK